MEYAQLCNSEKKKNKGAKGEGTNPESEAVPTALAHAKANIEKAKKAVQAAKLSVTTEGAKAFKLYKNLLSDESRQPWKKSLRPK